MDVPTLVTPRLVLVPLGVAHSDGMFTLWSSPDVCRYAGRLTDRDGNAIPSPVRDRADSDKILEFWMAAQAEAWGFRWGLLLRRSREFVGTAGFNSLGTSSEYAYHLHPDHWHQGVMSEASAAAFEWIADERSCTELVAVIAPENVNSIAFAERWGFRANGETPDHVVRYSRTL